MLAVKGNYTLAFFPCTMGIWQVNAMVRTATFLPCPGAQLAANSSTSTLGRPPVWPVTCDDASRAHRIAVRVVERTWLLHLTSKALRQTYRCHLYSTLITGQFFKLLPLNLVAFAVPVFLTPIWVKGSSLCSSTESACLRSETKRLLSFVLSLLLSGDTMILRPACDNPSSRSGSRISHQEPP